MPDPSYRVSTRWHPSRGWAGAENEGWQAVVAVSAVRGHGWISSFFLSPIISCGTDGFGKFQDITIGIKSQLPSTRALGLNYLHFCIFICYIFQSEKIYGYYSKIKYILKLKLYFDKKKIDFSKLGLNVLRKILRNVELKQNN